MIKKIILFIFIFLQVSSAYAVQDAPESNESILNSYINGNIWRKMELEGKYALICGIKVGINGFIHKTPTVIEGREIEHMRDIIILTRDLFLTKLTNEEIVSKIDAFYNDQYNRNIPIEEVYYCVCAPFSADWKEEFNDKTEGYIEKLRKKYNKLGFIDKDKYQKDMEEKYARQAKIIQEEYDRQVKEDQENMLAMQMLIGMQRQYLNQPQKPQQVYQPIVYAPQPMIYSPKALQRQPINIAPAGGIFGRFNPNNPFSEYNKINGKYNPNNPFSEYKKINGTLNSNNPFSETNRINGSLNPNNPFGETSSPFGSLNPNNPFSEVSSPFGEFNPNNPFSQGIHPYYYQKDYLESDE